MELMMNEESDKENTDDDDEEEDEEEARRAAEEALYQQIYYRTCNSSLGITGNDKEKSNYGEERRPPYIDLKDRSNERNQREEQTKSMSLMYKLGSNNNESSDEDPRERSKWKKTQTMKGESGFVVGENVQGNQWQKEKQKPTSKGLKEVITVEDMKKRREKCNFAEKSSSITKNGGVFKDSMSKFERKCEEKSSNALARQKKPLSLGQLTKGCSFPNGLLNSCHGNDEDDCEGNLSGFQGSDDDCFVISSDSDEDQYCEIIDENDIGEDSDTPEIIEDPVKKPPSFEVQSSPKSSVTKLQQTTSSRSRMRYFMVDSDIKCSNCYSFGHMSNSCPEDDKPPLCVLCGVKGHVSYSCPDRLCFNCDRPGHQTRDCAFPPQRPHHLCSRCNMFGHNKEMCPDQWRQYHMTIKEGELVKVERPDLKAMVKKMYCYNCGRQGHLGHMCEDPRMPLPKGEKVSLRSMPIVCQYKELRYPSAAPSGLDKEQAESDGIKREDISVLSSLSVEEIVEICQKKGKRNSRKPTKCFALPSFYQNKKNPKLSQKLENGSRDVSVFCGGNDSSVDVRYEYNQNATNCASGKRHLSSSSVSNHGNHARYGKRKRGKKIDLNSEKQDSSKIKATGNFQLLMAGIKNSGKYTKRKKTKKGRYDNGMDRLIMNVDMMDNNEPMPYWSTENPHCMKQEKKKHLMPKI